MVMTFIVPLLIGIVLGAVIVWLYYRSVHQKDTISHDEYNDVKKELTTKETELAVNRERLSSLSEDLSSSKKLIEALRETNSKSLEELSVVRTEKDNSLTRLNEIKKENEAVNIQLKEKTDAVISANKIIAQLQQEVIGKDDKLATQKKDFEEIKQNLEKEFKAIAGTILADNAKTFTDQQSIKLEDLLKPFREQIDGFKKDVDAKFTHEATEKGSLKQQIESLVILNQSISKEALALTEALRGSTKKQGDWGEDILERILEYSGLQKNVHYRVQQQSQNDDGKAIRPDVIVYYPDKRFLVIDAKVSLTHYWDFCNAATVEEQNACLPRIVGSLKGHIDGLSSKKYTDIEGTPDFIIMFMPVEAAYITAMQHDHSLWQYAYDKKILLISPTNLIPAMKMVSIMWDKDAINRDGEMIVAKAVKLYDKFHGFITTFESIGGEIDQAHKKWNEAKGQLFTGRDNFISQGSKLKILLGKRTTKELPAQLVDAANLEDDNVQTVNTP